ncbi:MAG: deoxyribonuclease IV [Chitinispirillia bacterium]|nr:deoxyribonuclease IV [Chitinispirillia bacterium]MCL2269285.1 deoxyribonuclease IV [Chitinispirillia bacterium]
MKYIGPHVSITGGVQNAPVNAHELGATGFGMFIKNQRQWVAKPLEGGTIDAFRENMALYGYDSKCVLVHDSYLINIGNPDKDKRKKSLDALIDEVRRCEALGLTLLNIHPGSHLGEISEEECLAMIAESLNTALDKTSGVTIVLEATAGQGSNIGGRFEHLADIIDRVEDKPRVGVCIDTCHIFAAGYDIRDVNSYVATMMEFDRIVGFKYMRGLHLNDAKNPLGSRVDRHESLGSGCLGPDVFRLLMEDERFDGIPCVLETVKEELWRDEVNMLKRWMRR